MIFLSPTPENRSHAGLSSSPIAFTSSSHRDLIGNDLWIKLHHDIAKWAEDSRVLMNTHSEKQNTCISEIIV